ncbi:MAG: hypothetical protein OXE96_10225 [Gemmatimonadetes bacterium]|nr:hypothetical protein [Gemmatimonadota bacterium]
MVNNYDRIYRELQVEARRISEDLDIDPEALATLALEIVDLEDRHRVSHVHAIHKQIRALIDDTAVVQRREDSDRD